MTTDARTVSPYPADWPEDTRERHAYLELVVRRFDCLVCKSQPRIAWMGMLTGESNHGLKCNCWSMEDNQLPKLAEPIHHTHERRWNMVRSEMARRPDALPEILVQDVKEQLSPNATDAELALFVRFCQSQDLNPFAREAHLVKIRDQPAYTVVDYKVLFRLAHRDPDYERYKAGIVILTDDDNIERRTGSMSLPGEQIVGGWCKVWMAGQPDPLEEEVSFAEFDTGQAVWNQKPGFMVEKTAITTLFRRAVRGIDELMRGTGTMRVEAADVEATIAKPAATVVVDNEPPPPTAPEENTADLFGPPAERPSVDADGVIQDVGPKDPPNSEREFTDQGDLLTAILSDFGVDRSGVDDILKAAGMKPLAEAKLTEVYSAVRAYANRGPDGE